MKKSKVNSRIILSIIIALLFGVVGFFVNAQSKELRVVKLNYNESARLNYKVYLNNNSYYNKDYLEEGMQYISSIINNIEVKYNYNILYDEKLDSNLSNVITANVKIVDSSSNDKIIYEKSEDIKSDKQEKKNVDNLAVDQTVKIDFQKYNAFANEFKSRYAISADCKLIVTFYTRQENNSKTFGNIIRDKTMTLEIPLSEQMINISKSPDASENSAYVNTTSATSFNKVLRIISWVLFGVAALFVMIPLYILIKREGMVSKYDKYIGKLLKQYDAYITEAQPGFYFGDNVINANSFKELLDVRNSIEKTIVFVKESNDVAKFAIIDDKQTYCYTALREDFD